MKSPRAINALALLLICILFPAWATAAFAGESIGEDIAELSAPSVYNFDDQQLPSLLEPFLEKQPDVVAIKIIENVNNEIFLKYYRDGDDHFFGQEIPQRLLSLDKEQAPIVYQGEELGHVEVYLSVDIIKVELTEEEQEWVNKTVVRVGVFDWAPFIKPGTEVGIDGIIGDYLKLVQQYTGLQINVELDSWDNLLAGIKDNSLDLLPAAYFTPDRADYGLFSKPFFKTPNHLYVKEENNDIKTMADLKGKKLAIVKSYSTIKTVSEKYPGIEIIQTNNLHDSISMVLNGEVDALYESQITVEYLITQELLVGLKGVAEVTFKAPSLHFFMGKDESKLWAVLQKGLDAIPQSERSRIISKWIPNSNTLDLTENERQWLGEYQMLKYSYDPNWGPLEWKNDLGEHQGIIADMLKLISAASGIEFEPVPAATWDDAVTLNKNGEVDMLSALGVTAERKQHLNFTDSTLYSTPFVFVSRLGDDYLEGFPDAAGKRIGVVASSTIQGIMTEKMPDVPLTPVDSIDTGFEQLDEGALDILLINAAAAKYYKNILGYSDTQITYRTPYNLELKVGLGKHVPKEAVSIISKSIDSISEKEISDIVHKWTTAGSAKILTDWALVAKIAGGLALVIFFVGWNNRKLKSMVDAKTEELQGLLHSFDQHVIASKSDTEGRITYVSDAFCEAYGYRREELIGKMHHMLRDPDLPKESYEEHWKTMAAGYEWNGEIKSRKKNGDLYWVEVVITPEYDDNGDAIGFTSVHQDITAKKAVEELSANLERMVDERTLDLEQAMVKIEELHKHTDSSIRYAALLQSSLTPNNELFREYFKEYFAIWHPRDIVGGDIYFFNELRNKDECMLMVIDCVGHGVPGAFVTMLVKAVEQQVMSEILNKPDAEISPGWVLTFFNQSLKKLLQQDETDTAVDAGFDGSVLYYNKKDKVLTFAGAAMPLFYQRPEDKKLQIIKGDKQSIGYKDSNPDFEFKDHKLEAIDDMVLYLTSDGYLDQNGGPKGFGFGKKRFKKMIHEYGSETMADQQEMFLYELAEYQGDKEQRDDITVVGLRI